MSASNEFNRGCFSILAGMLGGAVGAITFIILAFIISITACVVLVVIINAVVQRIDKIPTPRLDPPKGYILEDKMTLLLTPETGTIKTNVPGGKLTMNQSIDLNSLQFTPDPALIGKPIRLMDAHRKYDVSERTICNWANSGIVRVLERANKLLVLEESSVARAVAIFTKAREITTPRRAAWILKKAVAV